MEILQAAFLYLILIQATFPRRTLAILGFRNLNLSNPRIYYTTVELLCAEGYPAQEHKVVTEDGYILTVHRIPNGRRRPKVRSNANHYRKIHLNHHPDFEDCVAGSLNETATGLPVVMAHGLLMASDGWLLQGQGHDLAYLLADAGYDVWMVNVRGNFYSRVHKTLDPSDPKFWDFSFHENSYYDLPATIDYVLNKTRQNKTFYVGYSMGTAIFFAMTSMRQEFNSKILGFAGLAPVVYTKLINAPVMKGRIYDSIVRLVSKLKKRNLHEILPRNQQSIEFGLRFCSSQSLFQDLCYDLFTIIFGYHSKLVLRNKIDLYATHLPTGTSLKTVEHFVNNIKNNQLRKFDYGPKKNIQLYGQPVPPDYPIWNVTVPVGLYYSDGDFFYDLKDEEFLTALLKNVVDVNVQTNFNHVDYLWSFKAKDLVYSRAVYLFNRLKDEYYRGNRT